MGKKITLKESELKNIIQKSVKKNLNENLTANDIDISLMDINILKSIYRDLRLNPHINVFGNILSDIPYIKENIDDIIEPDEVVNKLNRKYNFPANVVAKREAFNKIYIYIITACVGINDKVIEDDMLKMGYFLGYRGKTVNIDEMSFQVLQFEPMSQLQTDETNNIKTKCNFLYHWTPKYNLENILNNGLIPSSKNSIYNYPNRIYLIRGDANITLVKLTGYQIFGTNNSELNDGEYVLLKIKIRELPENIHFFYDSNSELGVYTEDVIPKEYIEVLDFVNFKNKIKH